MQVIFDMDGTLLDSLELSQAAARRFAAAQGLPEPDPGQVKRSIGLTMPEYLAQYLGPDADIDRAIQQFKELEDEDIACFAKLFDGVPELLDALQADGVKTVLLSNAEADYIAKITSITGLDARLTQTLSARGFASKPAALRSLLAADPDAVMVGDTYMDTDAAAACGIPSIAATYGFGDPARLDNATYQADSPAAILSLVRELQAVYAARPAKRPRLNLGRANREKASGLYKFAAMFVHIVLTPWGQRDWRDQRKLPPTGGILIVCNHTSEFDPVTFGDFVIWSGRWPRYLAKIGLFKSKVIGWLLRTTESVPVDRASRHAADALGPAFERIRAGKAVLIYPEGTETMDPELWPMKARTGAARLALQARCPVIPCAQMGAEKVIPAQDHLHLPRRLFGQRFQAIVGDAIDLTEFYGLEPTREVLNVVTDRIMDHITALAEELRGEKAPADRWDRAQKQRVPVRRTLG